MGNTLKRFLSNKNTVTLLAIIVCVILVYAVYSWRLKSAVQTTTVCVASQTIPARTIITEDMLSTTKVLSTQITGNVIQDCGQVKGKYSSYAAEIPQNSLFYKEAIMTAEDMPDSAFDSIPDGETIYNLSVSQDSTYGNSIFPDDYIDLYLRTTSEDGKLLYGKFIQSIKVLGVKDSSGRNVFETTVETRTPARLLFAVPEDLYLLLKKAEYLGLQIVIVPRNNNYTAKAGETLVSSDYLKKLVLDQTATIPDECIKSETGTAECELDDANNDDADAKKTDDTKKAEENKDNN